MKDLIGKLTELEATAPKAPAGKKMLTEDSVSPPEVNKPTLKDVFETMAVKQPIPVVGKEGGTQQTGAGFLNVTDTSPAAQALSNALGDLVQQKKVQIVMPTQGQQSGQPAPAGATGQPQQGQMQMKEKDEGKPGKNFAKIAKSAAKRYGSKEAGERVAGAVRAKLAKQGKLEEEQLDELSPETLARYKQASQKRSGDIQAAKFNKLGYSGAAGQNAQPSQTAQRLAKNTMDKEAARGQTALPYNPEILPYSQEQGMRKAGQALATQKINRKAAQQRDWERQATSKWEDPVMEGAKVDRMVKHIEKSERKLGKSKDEAENIAWATANKRGMLDNKNKKKVKEASFPGAPDVEMPPMKSSGDPKRDKLNQEYMDIHREIKSLVDIPYSERSSSEQKARAKARIQQLNDRADEIKAILNPPKPWKPNEWQMKHYNLDADGNPLDSVQEADIPSTRGDDTMGVNLGAGRSMTTLEGKKPDFLDLDKDGNKKEPMKKAAADKKKKKVDESMNHRINAARLEGKSHGLRGHAYHGKAYEDIEEMKAYHDGYKEGMDELYEMGMYETAPAATVPGMASQAMEDNLSLTAPATLSAPWPALITYKHPTLGSVELLGYDDLDIAQDHVDSGDLTPKTEVVIYSKKDWEAPRKTLAKYVPQLKDLFDVAEGNAFTKALKDTPSGGKFSVGGKSYTDTSSLEEYAFEAWDRELANLLNEGKEVNEGLSVSVSKGNNHGEDSVNINATGPESEELLKLVKHAGLGLFGDEEHHEPSSAMSIQPAYGEPDEVGAGGVDVEVVDGHDGIMGLMQKLSGIQAAGEGDEDYKDEEDHEEEACNECGGMMEAGHNCGGKEMVDEVESEDQMEFEVAEDNAPDSGAEDSVADEDAEAKEDAALAGADSGDEEEMNESFAAMLSRLDRLAEGSGDEPKHPEHNEKDDKDYDDAEEELDESEQLAELSPELLDRAEDKAYDQYMNLASKAFDRGQSVKKDLGYGHYTKDVDPSTPLGKAAIAKHQQYKKFGDAGIKAVKRDQARADLDHVEANTSPAMRRKLGLDESELNEWANQVGKGPGKGTDASFEQDIDFMTKVIAGGLNKPKSTGQTTVPVIAGQEDRMHDNPQDWATLAGIKK